VLHPSVAGSVERGEKKNGRDRKKGIRRFQPFSLKQNYQEGIGRKRPSVTKGGFEGKGQSSPPPWGTMPTVDKGGKTRGRKKKDGTAQQPPQFGWREGRSKSKRPCKSARNGDRGGKAGQKCGELQTLPKSLHC